MGVKGGRFHRCIWFFLWHLAAPFLKAAFRYRCRVFRFPRGEKKVPFLVIANHTTDADPVFVGCSFSGHLYYVSSEHILRHNFTAKVLRFFFSPIPIIKAAADTGALRNILGRLKAGYNICLFAEGNRSFSGVTGNIPASTGKLVRLAAGSGAGLVTYRIRGGYFAGPRWSRKMRKGPVWGEPAAWYSPETLRAMKGEEINALVKNDIFEDAYETMRRNPKPYRTKNPAEDLQTALYLCPRCGRIGTLRSAGDTLSCDCGLCVRYDQYGALCTVSGTSAEGSGADGTPHEAKSFATVRDWWFWQYEAMETVATEGFSCSDEGEALYEIDPRCGPRLLSRGTLSLGKEGLRCASCFFPLHEIAELEITGQRTLTFCTGGKLYELRNSRPRSAAKYQRVFELLSRPASLPVNAILF